MSFAENLAKVFSLMDPNSPERVAFVSRALKWSSGGSGKLGHPRLHQLLALTLWKGGYGVPSSQQLNPLCVCLLISRESLSFNISALVRSSTGHTGPWVMALCPFQSLSWFSYLVTCFSFHSFPFPPPPPSVYPHLRRLPACSPHVSLRFGVSSVRLFSQGVSILQVCLLFSALELSWAQRQMLGECLLGLEQLLLSGIPEETGVELYPVRVVLLSPSGRAVPDGA